MNGDYEEITMTFDLRDLLDADVAKSLLSKLLMSEVNDLIAQLRGLFVVDAEIQELTVPPSWEGMDELFQAWLIAVVADQSAAVSLKTKREWERMPRP